MASAAPNPRPAPIKAPLVSLSRLACATIRRTSDLGILNSFPAESVRASTPDAKALKPPSRRSPLFSVTTSGEPRRRTSTLSQLPGITSARPPAGANCRKLERFRPTDAQPAVREATEIINRMAVKVFDSVAAPLDAVVASMLTALEPGGRVAIVDFTPPGPEAVRPADRANDGRRKVAGTAACRAHTTTSVQCASKREDLWRDRWTH